MYAASPLGGAIDRVAPVELVEQRIQSVLVAGDRVGVVQRQPRLHARFDRLHSGGRCVPALALLWLVVGTAALSVCCMAGLISRLEEVDCGLLHHPCLFCEERTHYSQSPRFQSRAGLLKLLLAVSWPGFLGGLAAVQAQEYECVSDADACHLSK